MEVGQEFLHPGPNPGLPYKPGNVHKLITAASVEIWADEIKNKRRKRDGSTVKALLYPKNVTSRLYYRNKTNI